MNVYPFHPRAAHCGAPLDATFDHDFPFDDHPDFSEFDDCDDRPMNRFGSIDRQYRYAHRTISATVLATLTGVDVGTCQAVHSALFELLERVGDFDGLVAVPSLLISGRDDRVAPAAAWLQENPPPDVGALWEAADFDEVSNDEVGLRIEAAVAGHSLDLAVAAGTNPSLTWGSLTALEWHLGDEVLELMDTYQINNVERLTKQALELLLRLPDGIRLVGGAVIHALGHAERAVPPESV